MVTGLYIIFTAQLFDLKCQNTTVISSFHQINTGYSQVVPCLIYVNNKYVFDRFI